MHMILLAQRPQAQSLSCVVVGSWTCGVSHPQTAQQEQGRPCSSSTTLQLEVHCAAAGSSAQQLDTISIAAQPWVSICHASSFCHIMAFASNASVLFCLQSACKSCSSISSPVEVCWLASRHTHSQQSVLRQPCCTSSGAAHPQPFLQALLAAISLL